MAGRNFQTKLGENNNDSLAAIDWTFPTADTQYLTHGLHPYPARMIPQIPHHLLEYFIFEDAIEPGDRLYDPFCGSGTSLVEARLHGLHGEGNDINPLACMLTLAKSRPLYPATLNEARNTLFHELSETLQKISSTFESGEQVAVEEPDVNDGWFPKPQLFHLVHLRERIDRLEDEYGEGIARFFRVALSKTTRLTSYQRNGEFKRYRIPKEKRDDHGPDVLSIFAEEVDKNVESARQYSERVEHALETVVHYADSRTAEDVRSDSADIVITSPPYGDHDTTVAYGQFSQDPAIICGNHGYEEMRNVDKTGLGGSNRKLEPLSELEEWSPSLHATLDTLQDEDGRATDAMQFFRDYFEVMKQVARVLRPGQPAVWVVANRTMSRVNIPTHLITRELCEYLGFEHRETLPREIPNKTMPWENAPENVPGKTGALMAKENIVILNNPT